MSTKLLVLLLFAFSLPACDGADTTGLPGDDGGDADNIDSSPNDDGGNGDRRTKPADAGDTGAEAVVEVGAEAGAEAAPDISAEPAPECTKDSDCGTAECLDKCTRKVHFCDRGLCQAQVFTCECKRKCVILDPAGCGPSWQRLPKAAEAQSECSAGVCVDVTLANCKCDATYAATCNSATGFCNP